MEYGKGYSAKVDDRFSIHIAEENEEELNAIVNFSMEVHQEEVLETYIRHVFLEHPRKSKILWLYIRDNKQNKIASCICLSPLEWQIEDIILPVSEMEFVGTREMYREKGFIKILNGLYENIMEQNGYVLSVIRGIPYFYRKLGYEYVSSLDERITIPVSKIPNKNYKNIKIRKANFNDIPFIESTYNQFHKNFYIFNRFDSKCFKFKFLKDHFNSEVRSTYIFDEEGTPQNYFSLGMSYDNECYEIHTPDLTKREMITLLQFIKVIGNYKENDIIPLSISEHTSLFSYLKSLGGNLISNYGWQVKIPNFENFFQIVKKIIEDRIRNSEFKGLTKVIRLSNYHLSIELNLNNGEIGKASTKKEYPNPQVTDLRMPGALLFKVLLGDRTIHEINHIVKDMIVNTSSKSLIEAMFPKKISLFGTYI